MNILERVDDLWLTIRGVRYASTTGRTAQRWSADERAEFQVRHLRKLAVFAQRYVPHYTQLFAETGFSPSGITSVDDLKRLPILEKPALLADQSRFCSYESLRDSVKLRTSGTTGQPMLCFTSKSQWVVEQGAVWRQWGWAGYRFRDRMAVIRSYRPPEGAPPVRFDRLRNWLFLSPYHLDRPTVRTFLGHLSRWRPAYLRGYPNSLAMVAQFALEEKIKLPSLKAALTASETLRPSHRAVVREAFGIEIFDHYGQAEISTMLHECERHDGMHVLDDYAVTELVPTGDPTRFRLVATNLHNTAMPLIRYDTGDIVLGPLRHCKCGRSFPVVDQIEGRADENLDHAQGYAIPSVNIYTFMAKQDQVRRFQVIQEPDGRLRIILDLKPDAKGAADAVSKYFREGTGQLVDVDSSGAFVQTGEGKSPTILKRRRP